MRRRTSQAAFAILLLVMRLPEAQSHSLLQKPSRSSASSRFNAEPIYAEVPQKVWWNARSPKDDYDEKSLRTLDNLAERRAHDRRPAARRATAPSTSRRSRPRASRSSAPHRARAAPSFAALICCKNYDGLRNFQRHPTEPTTGHARARLALRRIRRRSIRCSRRRSTSR